MQIEIRVIPGASKNMIKEDDGIMRIYLTTAPVDGKANQALVKFLAKHYNVSKSSIGIIKGEKSRNKIIKIDIS
jgi:hypothetical protein